MMRRRRFMITSFVFVAVATLFLSSLRVLVTRHVFTSSSSSSPSLASNTAVRAASLLAIRKLAAPSPSSGHHRLRPPAVLLPDWEALLLLPPACVDTAGPTPSCLFHNGAASRARFAGVVPSSGLAAFRCVLPNSVRRSRPFHSPRLVSAAAGDLPAPASGSPEMTRWTRVVYEAVSTADDVIVFAKGVNHRPGANFPAADLLCVFSSDGGGDVVAVAATSSAQEVFRCPHPPPSLAPPLHVTLAVPGDAAPLPSLATYSAAAHGGGRGERALMCACTMVYNAAKFLDEWVAYHAAVGVDRFFLYDNGSEDDLNPAVGRLAGLGYNVSTRFWPWPKTQEAGFSHCAAAHATECQWMAFVDVDEFVFSPHWARSARPDPSMMASLVAVGPTVGQVVVGCHEFGPSGQKSHPKDGVTQGYTCRLRQEARHKSLVRLDAIDRSLLNSVHHFGLRDGFTTAKAGWARVNHYKYQAWDEFKVKFRRRVSAYVADWTANVNPGSRDRTPGLGLKAVRPDGWDRMFCEVSDTKLRDAARRWFAVSEPNGRHRMLWEHR